MVVQVLITKVTKPKLKVMINVYYEIGVLWYVRIANQMNSALMLFYRSGVVCTIVISFLRVSKPGISAL